MRRFELLLKNEKIRSYRRIATFLILINIAVFILLAVRTNSYTVKIICFATPAVLTFFLFVHVFFNGFKKNIYQTIDLCFMVVAWMLMAKWLAAVVCIILLFLYLNSINPLKISLSNEDIRYISFPSKILKWSDLGNVVLKDDILTIDFKNNKLLQAEIEDGDIRINEEEFNEFCRQQLKDNRKSNDS